VWTGGWGSKPNNPNNQRPGRRHSLRWATSRGTNIHSNHTERSTVMAATPQQGSYLATTLIGFTAFPAGLVTGGAVGAAFAIAGLGFLIYSAAGFYRIKNT
jgi:hypothetical protein